MNDFSLDAAIRELNLEDTVDQARQAALVRELSITPIDDKELHRLPRLGFVFELQGLKAYRDWQSEANNQDSFRQAFRSALSCWLALSSVAEQEQGGANVSTSALEVMALEVSVDPLPSDLALAFHLAVSGLLGERIAETRLQLSRFLVAPVESGDWLRRVASNIAVACICLVRKAKGWQDIDTGLKAIQELRAAQEQFEDRYVDQQGDTDNQTRAALRLVGYYHLAQMITTVGEYLKSGKGGHVNVGLSLDRHLRQALEAFRLTAENQRTHFAELLWVGSREIIRNSIWNHIEGLPDGVRKFGEFLIKRSEPVLELWPSQQEALRRSFLDPYPRAIIVEMPTSAGKTLLAKFAIVQAKAFNNESIVAYVVPTRALVNQITFELRQDFAALEYRVESAVPAFELDPTESKLLSEGVDIIVTTPEKLDLLVRAEHPVVKNLSLIIADEAHNLQDGNRGARLELLLGTIKREKQNARFLLLSPFLPNGKELVTWLGDDRALPPIQIGWKPSSKVVGASICVGRKNKRHLALEVLPSIDNTAIKPGTQIAIGENGSIPEKMSITSLSLSTIVALSKRGGVLVLCRGRGTAMKRAHQVAGSLPVEGEPSELRQAVCEYLTAEAGYETGLVKCLRRGVAYHHAGLSHEARWLVERLIREKEVRVVCGTTTLAQGVNFPISTVVIETLRKGGRDLSFSDFWNVAGRAGRALMDTVGIVAFPAPSKSKKEEYIEFLQGEALEVSSQLAALIVAADQIGENFNLVALRNHPELSALLQFLAHAIRVSEHDNLADEMENLLRSSLVYHQLRRTSQNSLDKFVGLCRAYVRQVIAKQKDILAVADKTGFATPSVLYLMGRTKEHQILKRTETWLPENLFAENVENLKHCIEVISGVPEMKLSEGKGGILNATRVAQILRDWVHGTNLDELAERYGQNDGDDDDGEDDREGGEFDGVDVRDSKVASFATYLFSTLIGNASWGLGALEGLCLSSQDKVEVSDIAHVPSMVFFGVRSKEAVWLRMAGVPRMVAERTADLWRNSRLPPPQSYGEIRSWINQLKDGDWETILSKNDRPITTPKNIRIIWKELSGIS
jgi:replicative superfamily II helicase